MLCNVIHISFNEVIKIYIYNIRQIKTGIQLTHKNFYTPWRPMRWLRTLFRPTRRSYSDIFRLGLFVCGRLPVSGLLYTLLWRFRVKKPPPLLYVVEELRTEPTRVICLWNQPFFFRSTNGVSTLSWWTREIQYRKCRKVAARSKIHMNTTTRKRVWDPKWLI